MTRKHRRWLRNSGQLHIEPAPATDYRTAHTGLVLGIEGSAPSKPTAGWSADKRWAMSVPAWARKPS